MAIELCHPFFPPIGTPFDLTVDGESLRVQVSAVPCECVGYPHEHYRIEGAELSGHVELRRGRVLNIRNASGAYSLE